MNSAWTRTWHRAQSQNHEVEQPGNCSVLSLLEDQQHWARQGGGKRESNRVGLEILRHVSVAYSYLKSIYDIEYVFRWAFMFLKGENDAQIIERLTLELTWKKIRSL